MAANAYPEQSKAVSASSPPTVQAAARIELMASVRSGTRDRILGDGEGGVTGDGEEEEVQVRQGDGGVTGDDTGDGGVRIIL